MCCWVVVLFFWLDCVVATKVVGQKIFRGMGKGSLVLVEMGLWECFFVCVGNLGCVISHCRIYGKD